MPKLGFVGCGVVGSATLFGFLYNNYCSKEEIRIYDKYKKEINIRGFRKNTESLEDVVKSSQFIFVCLPTPYKVTNREKIDNVEVEWGEIDLSIIEENIDKIVNYYKVGSEQVIIIRSTVIPGTTKSYSEKYPGVRFCFNPEFLREKTAYEDFLNPDRIVIGADDEHTRLIVRALYANRFPEVPLFLTDSKTAEMSKYMANITLATIIMLGNQMCDICNEFEINYEEVKKIVKADHRLENVPLDVTSVRGFGGKCFPKDLVAIIKRAEKSGINVDLLKSIWYNNLRIRKLRDWHDIPGARTI